MKAKIHPNYNEKVLVSCTCGNKFEAGSTVSQINVEICSKCHPFFTGEEKFVDMEGKVDAFKRKRDSAEKLRKERIEKIKLKINQEKQKEEAPKTLKEMLKALQ